MFEITVARITLNATILNQVHNITLASVHYEATAARNVDASKNNLVKIITLCHDKEVDLIGFDGNQTLYARTSRSGKTKYEKSAWEMAWEEVTQKFGAANWKPEVLCGNTDEDVVGLWLTPWSTLHAHKGGTFGYFDISKKDLGLRESDKDAHHITYLRIKTTHGGKRSYEANAKRHWRDDWYAKKSRTWFST